MTDCLVFMVLVFPSDYAIRLAAIVRRICQFDKAKPSNTVLRHCPLGHHEYRVGLVSGTWKAEMAAVDGKTLEDMLKQTAEQQITGS